MTSKCCQSRSSGNVTQNFAIDHIIKQLDEEFVKFENGVKKCHNFDSLNVTLPVHMVELFSKFFKIWSNTPPLRRVIDATVFLDVYSELQNFFDLEDEIDSASDEEECCGNCYGMNDMFEQFVESMREKIPSAFDSNDTSLKGKKDTTLPGDEWLTERNGFVVCNICNTKYSDMVSLFKHMNGVDHMKNFNALKQNETVVGFPDVKSDCFKCKPCSVEYSNLNSLIKHFSKPQHQRSKDAPKSTPTPTPEKKSNCINSKTEVKSSTKVEYNQKFILTKGSGKFCQLCDKDLASVPNVISHVKSSDHLEKLSVFESNQVYAQLSLKGDNFHCVLCGVFYGTVNILADHFASEGHKKLVNLEAGLTAQAAPAPKPKPSKPNDEKLINSVQLRDSDKKFVVQWKNVVCILCSVELNLVAEIIAHINGKSHLQNVYDFNSHESYVKLPTPEISTFGCTKCSQTCDNFSAMLTHCKERHINPPKPKPQETFQLKERDEKFIKSIMGKNSKCNLCEKDLPTTAAVISHTESSNHVKNCNVFYKNETYAKLPCKNSTSYRCTACKHEYNDLMSLVKHFKDDAHNKTVTEGKKPKLQEQVHIPSHAKAKPDPITTPKTSKNAKNKPSTPKKDRKPKDEIKSTNTPAKSNDIKSSVKTIPQNDQPVVQDDRRVYRPFPMKKPDNSYVIAKNDLFYCRLCNLDLPSITVAAHMNGATHRINADVLETCECFSKPAQEPAIECTMCQITFDNIHEIVKHFKEKRHVKPGTIVTNGSGIQDGIFGSTDSPKIIETAKVTPKRIPISKCDRQHIFRLNGIIRCNLCGAKLNDFEALSAHISNLNHKRNSTVFLENELYIKQLDDIRSNFACTLCSFSSALDQVIKHCKKKQHLKAKSNGDSEQPADDVTPLKRDVISTITEFDRKCIVMKNGIVRCNLCHSKLPRESTLISHMSGPNHKQFCIIYKDNEPYIEQFDEMGYSYRCTICDVIFTRLDTMLNHCTEESHVLLKAKVHQIEPNSKNENVSINVTNCDFECVLCSITFTGFANLSKHCYSKQHKILKTAIQPIQKAIPDHVTITDYQYHCNACDTRLYCKSSMEKHHTTPEHVETEKQFRRETRRLESPLQVIELVGYVYLCNLCWLPMYSEAELAVHEKTKMHKMGKNFDDVWKYNDNYLQLSPNAVKVECKLCETTFGIEKLVQHCTSRSHRVKYIADQMNEYTADEHIVWKNATQYCTLCDCKLINDHNLINHVNSEGHKIKIIKNCA